MSRLLRTLAASAAFASTAVLAGCGEKNQVQVIDGPAPTAYVKFFNFGLNAPSVNFYAGNQKMSAIVSTTGIEAVTGVAYGSVSSGGFYGSIEPGTYTLTGKISAAVDKDLVIATQNQLMEDGKRYSFYMSGLYNTTTKTSDSFVVVDDYPDAFNYASAQVRFVNASFNAAPMQLILTGTVAPIVTDTVGAAIAYKSAGAFETVVPGVYNIATRTVGATTNTIARTAVTFLAGRIYTISARGDMTVVSTTATNRPFLDNTTNR